MKLFLYVSESLMKQPGFIEKDTFQLNGMCPLQNHTLDKDNLEILLAMVSLDNSLLFNFLH